MFSHPSSAVMSSITSFAHRIPRYCSSLTFSIQSTVLPSSCSTMAMCVIAVLEVAPCQCFSPGGHQTTSPGRISSFGPPSLCTQPHPNVTIRVCPSGCLCHAVRAPGSNVTLTPRTRAGSGAWNSGSMRTMPVKYSSGPLPEGCEPLLLSCISEFLHLIVFFESDSRTEEVATEAQSHRHCDRDFRASFFPILCASVSLWLIWSPYFLNHSNL